MWYLYILKCKNGALYTGITTDPGRRFREHQQKSAKYTSYNPPIAILYTEPHPDRSSASRREHAVKAMSRAAKLRLCRGD